MSKKKHWTQTKEGRVRLSTIVHQRWERKRRQRREREAIAAENEAHVVNQTSNPYRDLSIAIDAIWAGFELHQKMRAIAKILE